MGGIYEGVPAGGPTEPLQLIDEGAPTPAEAQQSESSQMADLTYRVLVLGLRESPPSSFLSRDMDLYECSFFICRLSGFLAKTHGASASPQAPVEMYHPHLCECMRFS